MRRIFKYKLKLTDLQFIDMPEDAAVLSVGVQEGNICLWVLVEDAGPLRSRAVQIIGTGNPIAASPAGRFVGRVETHGGALVWHVFAESRQ